MKLNEVMWFDYENYPIRFYHKNPMISFTKEQRPSEVIVFGLLKEGESCYKGVTLAYCAFEQDTMLGVNRKMKWIDLRTLIDEYGDYIADV